MSKEKRVRIAILDSEEWARFKRPEARCLQLSTPMEPEKALEVADRYTELLPQLKGLVFIEEGGVKATKELQCEHCNKRLGKRQDFEYLISEPSPKNSLKDSAK